MSGATAESARGLACYRCGSCGDVHTVTGAGDRHGLIVNALAFALTPAARRKGCQLFTSVMKLRLAISGKTVFYYPDLLLSCDPEDRESHFRQTPCLLIEVLSGSTERIDRREKLLAYQTLPSLQAYWMVAQDARRVEVHRRADNWQAQSLEDAQIAVDGLDLTLAVEKIDQDV